MKEEYEIIYQVFKTYMYNLLKLKRLLHITRLNPANNIIQMFHPKLVKQHFRFTTKCRDNGKAHYT